MADSNFRIHYLEKSKLPRLAFSDMKNAALGSDYALTLIVADKTKMQELNRTYRKLDEPTDILSFPINETEGEIYMNLDLARKEAEKFSREYDNFIGFLFIHGLVHLKGYDHGGTMESIEVELRKQFGI